MSVRTYAANVGVKYYVFSDWYRDYKASVEYWNLSTKGYSEKRINEVENIISFFAGDGFSLVKITRGRLQ